eukprot:CAMPEP_0115396580 /NCGR_PEP_ID=MMETSP0271-20121206/13366_1 /TAXON_ID=71861 /ORGANISM="Scrippsiella trochoidea, Strain CCMP3099" /LENGTH=362 /DNA_ID=CAMNT_0002820309 /DNA_START=35 /DNA_END=1120 /DNA_ORIENTATION=-
MTPIGTIVPWTEDALGPPRADDEDLSAAMYVWLLCFGYIVAGVGLILLRSFMMQPGQFPYPMEAAAIHMAFFSLFSAAFYWWRPSTFPGMALIAGRRGEFVKRYALVGIPGALVLYFSHQALKHCSVFFLLSVKQTRIISMFLTSCLAGLQVLDGRRLSLFVVIITGCILAIDWETDLSFVGLVFQLSAQHIESSRAIVGEMVAASSDVKVDSLSATVLSAPTCCCALLLGSISLGNPTAPFVVLTSWPYLFASASLAFAMHVMVAEVTPIISAAGVAYTCAIRDVMAVMVASAVCGNEVTWIQYMGFLLALASASYWSCMEAHPGSAAGRTMGNVLWGSSAGAGTQTEQNPFEVTCMPRGW